MDIICRKTNCKHNKKFVCLAKKNEIKNTCECNTFCNCCKHEIDTSQNIYCTPPTYHKYRSCGKLDIDCQAKCQFNKNGKCVANGVTINVLNECPYCITFFPKIKK